MKVLKFYADWCGPCKALTEVIKKAGDKVTIPVENVNIAFPDEVVKFILA